MNPMPSRGEDGRRRWTTPVLLAGLLLVGALAVTNRVELMRLPAASRAEAQDARLDALAARVAELVQEIEAARQRPESTPLAHFDAEREIVERRLTAIEEALDARSPDDGLQAVLDRLTRLEEARTQTAAHRSRPGARAYDHLEPRRRTLGSPGTVRRVARRGS